MEKYDNSFSGWFKCTPEQAEEIRKLAAEGYTIYEDGRPILKITKADGCPPELFKALTDRIFKALYT